MTLTTGTKLQEKEDGCIFNNSCVGNYVEITSKLDETIEIIRTFKRNNRDNDLIPELWNGQKEENRD